MELIGAKLPSINRAEDRQIFRDAMTEIGLKTPLSGTATSMDEAYKVLLPHRCGALSDAHERNGVLHCWWTASVPPAPHAITADQSRVWLWVNHTDWNSGSDGALWVGAFAGIPHV